MRRASSALISLLLLGSTSPAFAGDLGSMLVAKIQKSGLGCIDAKVDTTKILYAPKRVVCTVEGEHTNIETYTQANFKKANSYLCSSGLDLPVLTDKKFWIIAPETVATMKLIRKFTGGFIITTCKIR